ncbi:MAG: PIN domain-containing protein [Thermoplasmatota archaeon]
MVVFKENELGDNHIILDANALMSPFQFSINLDVELTRLAPGHGPVVPTSVVRELDSLLKKGDWRVKASLELARKYPWVDIKGRGDGPIFNLALRKRWMVMTQDKRLRKNLLQRGIPVVIIRDKGHLKLMEP